MINALLIMLAVLCGIAAIVSFSMGLWIVGAIYTALVIAHLAVTVLE